MPGRTGVIGIATVDGGTGGNAAGEVAAGTVFLRDTDGDGTTAAGGGAATTANRSSCWVDVCGCGGRAGPAWRYSRFNGFRSDSKILSIICAVAFRRSDLGVGILLRRADSTFARPSGQPVGSVVSIHCR